MVKYDKSTNLTEYHKLRNCFLEFLKCYTDKTEFFDVKDILRELLELADQQWHTYELLDKEIIKQLEKYLKSVINLEEEEIMDYILCIIPRLGMGDLFKYILQNKDEIKNNSVLTIIDESESEYGANVYDPYSVCSVLSKNI